MYLAERATAPAGAVTRAGGRVGRTVLLLGATSLVTDVSAEMVTTVLPLYVVFQLGMTPLAVGMLEAVYQAVAALVRIAGGLVTDRWNRARQVATAGYAVSAAARLGLLLLPGGLGAVTAMTAADRLGKGVRTAPRDALIAAAAPAGRLATAFGVHRALDTAGSLLGPFAALGVLALSPHAFDAVFVLSFLFAVLGVGIIGLLVDDPPRAAAPSRLAVATRGLLRDRHLRRLVAVAGLLGLVTVSDAFLYLALQRRVGFTPGLLPLLYVATAAVYLVLAVPAGALADRAGRGRTFGAGYALLLAAYLVVVAPAAGWLTPLLCVALLGAYYACTDGVLAALASAALPPGARATGLAFVTTAASLGKVVAAVAFGALWTACGVGTAVAAFAGALGILLLVGIAFCPRTAEVVDG